MNCRLHTCCIVLCLGLAHSVSQAGTGSPLRDYMANSYQKLTPAERARLKAFSGSTAIKLPSAGSVKDSLLGLLDNSTGAIWGKYEKVAIPGATCSDGSQYKIFVMRANAPMDFLTGNNRRLTVEFEPGGACWDYESCSGQSGIRGAAHPDGIPDNLMNLEAYLDPNVAGGSINAIITPLILKNHPSGQSVKTAYWNKVFIPYCTGDVYSGNKIATYTDPKGSGKTITYRHVGAKNMEKVVEWLKNNFYQPKELFVSGASAGGAGALINYHFIRKGLNPEKSYLLDDSGPVFPAPGSGNQYSLHKKIRQAWNIDYLIGKLQQDRPASGIAGDFGSLSTLLADAWPNDKIAITLFRRDEVYSAYSYSRFYGLDESNPVDKEKILTLWNEDIRNLITQYSSRPNMSYYIPYYRNLAQSHCTTVVEWNGTEIQAQNVNVGNFINSILNDAKTSSRIEADNPNDANVKGVFMELINLIQ